MGTPPTTSGMLDPRMMAVVKKQRIQDFVFHKVTMLVAGLVLVARAGILVSLMISAWPAFKKFGIDFIWTVEWDIINEDFGAAIAIYGTLVSSAIALLIAVPLAFGIALFLNEMCPVWLRRPLGTAI